MQKPYHIVFTTIYQPLTLNELYDNISRFGHLDEAKVWVIGDHKTPQSAAELAAEINQKGLEVEYWDIAMQDDWGKDLEFYKRIPYNSDARRLVGFLKAYEEGCKLLISIDDDNFPSKDDFIGWHSKTGQIWRGELVSEPKGFYNICEYLEFEPSRQIFPRGYPFKLRGLSNQSENIKTNKEIKVGVTEGLWLGKPDVDATTWLNGKVESIKYKGPDFFVLDQKTWSPVNTQNVSVVRELIPAYFFVPMAWPVPGGKIDRYGDIWGGYFLLALMQNTNYYVAFGRPLIEHRRNPHSYIDDLRYEFWGMVFTDWLLETLKMNFSSKKNDVISKVFDLAEFLKIQAQNNMPEWSPKEIQAFLLNTAENLNSWGDTFRQLKM